MPTVNFIFSKKPIFINTIQKVNFRKCSFPEVDAQIYPHLFKWILRQILRSKIFCKKLKIFWKPKAKAAKNSHPKRRNLLTTALTNDLFLSFSQNLLPALFNTFHFHYRTEFLKEIKGIQLQSDSPFGKFPKKAFCKPTNTFILCHLRHDIV